MKRLLALLLAVCMLSLCLLSVGCSGGKENGTETAGDSGTAAPSESKEPTGTTAGKPAESDKQTDAATEPAETTDPNYPPFDKSQPWDGVSACLEWYIEGDDREGWKLSDVYDFYGFSLLANMAGIGNALYYDPNYMVIYDTDGDGDYSDEQGYADDRITIGDKFTGAEIFLMNDIDLNNQVWTPIAAVGSFQGLFNGRGHTIKNFRVTTESASIPAKTYYYYGLFGILAVAAEAREFTIENETLEVEAAEGAIGMMAGGVAAQLHSTGGGVLTDVTVKGLTIKVTGTAGTNVTVGAIVGACGNTLVQTNVHVTDYELIDEYSGEEGRTLNTQPDNFTGSPDKSNLFVNCTVELKK